MFNFFKIFKKDSGLKIGDVFIKPVNGEAAKNGFGEYVKPKDFYEVIDVNENGIMSKRYLAERYGNLQAGWCFKPDFTSHETLIRWFKLGYYVRPSDEYRKMLNIILRDYKN